MGIHNTAMVSKSAEIDATVEIGAGVTVESGVIIHPGVRIMTNAYIFRGTEIGEGTIIHPGAVIGNEPQDLGYKGEETFTKIGKNNIIREYVTIHRGSSEGTSTVLGDNVFLMVQAHVGHNCEVGDNTIIANGVLLAGYTIVGESVFIAGNVIIHQFCRLGSFSMIGGFSAVNKDVPPYMTVRGPSLLRGVNLIGLRRAGFKRDAIKRIKEAYRILFLSGVSRDEAVARIKETMGSDEIASLISFIEASKRGICTAITGREKYFEEVKD